MTMFELSVTASETASIGYTVARGGERSAVERPAVNQRGGAPASASRSGSPASRRRELASTGISRSPAAGSVRMELQLTEPRILS